LLAPLVVRRANHQADPAGDERAEAGSGEHLERDRIVHSGEGDAQCRHGGEGALGNPRGKVCSCTGHHDMKSVLGPKRFPGERDAAH